MKSFNVYYLLVILIFSCSFFVGNKSKAQDLNLLSIVEGTVTLNAPKDPSELEGELKRIYKGSSEEVQKRKKIKVEGINNGRTIKLEGEDENGGNYFFSIVSPGELNELPQSKKAKIGFSEINFPSISFIAGNMSGPTMISSVSETGSEDATHGLSFKSKRLTGSRSEHSGILKGTFSKETASGKKASGRFVLKLSGNAD